MKTRSILWIGAAALGGAACFVLLQTYQAPALAPAPMSRSEPKLFSFVRSMEGTQPDGNFKPAASDTAVSNHALRRLFDYYLSAIGEQSVESIRIEIERALEQKLSPIETYRAKKLLMRYLAYKRDLFYVEKNLTVAGSQAVMARERLTAMQQARKRFFGDLEVSEMFGFDDAYDEDAVARLEISEDKTLTIEQKQEKFAMLDQVLAPALRQAREAPLQAIRLDEAAANMRAQGSSEDDIYRMRAAAVSPEAAARLAAVDQEQIVWKNRIAAYLAERKKLLNVSGLSGTNLSTAIQQLRDAQFNTDEQMRLQVYEQGS